MRRGRRFLRWVQPREALIFESQIAETSRQTESDENQENFADAPVVRGFFFIEQIVEIGTGRGVGVDAQARAATSEITDQVLVILGVRPRAAAGYASQM